MTVILYSAAALALMGVGIAIGHDPDLVGMCGALMGLMTMGMAVYGAVHLLGWAP